MSDFHAVITKLEADNSRLYKEKVLAAETDNEALFLVLQHYMDPLVTFGIKLIPDAIADGPGLLQADFDTVADQLHKRTLSGHAAQDAVATLAKQATVNQWNTWYKRLLLKDLRCGVSETTINKVLKVAGKSHLAIPVFACQLAVDSTKHEKKVCGKKFIDVKLDGVRTLTIVYPNGTVNQYTRNGRELLNFPLVREQFASIAGELDQPYVFDGEIMSANFQDLMKQIHRKEGAETTDSVLHLFDIIPLSEFTRGIGTQTQTERNLQLKTWFSNKIFLQMMNVTVVDHELVDLDTAAGKARFKEINQLAIDGGYEGIMIKDPDAVYECKRRTHWMKLKPYIEVSLTIIGFEEGEGGKRNEGRLGALIVKGTDDGKHIVTNVGSGYSDAQRQEFWDDRELLMGQIVEVRADAATKAQDKDEWSLRFPRFRGFRGFTPGEKI